MAPSITGILLAIFCFIEHIWALAPSDQLGYIISYKDDELHLPISQLYNLTSSTKYPACTLQAGSPGEICDGQTCNTELALTQSLSGKILFTKQVSMSQLMGVLSEDATLSLVVATLASDAKTVTNTVVLPFSNELPQGVNMICQDLEFDRVNLQVFIACKKDDDTAAYVVTVNLVNPIKPEATLITPKDQFKFSGIVRIFLANFTSTSGKNLPSLSVFCQSLTNVPTQHSQAWVYIWGLDPATGKLTPPIRFIDLTSSGIFAVTSIFENSGTLVISGKPQGADATTRLQIAQCKIPDPEANQALVCEKAKNTINENYNGYVGKTYSGIYVEAYEQGTAEQKSIIVDRCTFMGPDLKDLDCTMTSSIVNINTRIPDGAGIFSIEDSNFITIVKFASASGEMNTYAGIAFSVGAQISGQGFVTPISSTLLELTNKSVFSRLFTQPYYHLQVNTLQSDSVAINVICTDSTASNVKKTISLNVLRQMGDLVMPSLFQGPPSLALEHAVESTFTFSPKFILGNNLRAMLYPQPRQQTGTVNYKQRDFVNTTLILDGAAVAQLPTKFAIAGNFAAIIDDQGTVVGLQCLILDGFDIAHYSCNRIQNTSLKVATDTTFQQTFSSRTTSVFLLSSDSAQQLFIMQLTKSGNVEASLIYKSPSSQTAVSIDENLLITVALVSSDHNQIEVFYAGAVIKDTPQSFKITGRTINMRSDDFTPLRIQFNPLYPSQLVVLYSSGSGANWNLATIQLHTSRAVQSVQPILDVLFSFAVTSQPGQNYQICALNTETVVFDGQNIRSYSAAGASRNVWNFGTNDDDLGFGTGDYFRCLQFSNAFVTRSVKTEKSLASINIYWGNSQYLANNKVFRGIPCTAGSSMNLEVFESPSKVLLVRLNSTPDGLIQTPHLFASYTSARHISASITLADPASLGPSGSSALVTTFDFSNGVHQMTFSEPVALWTNISNTSTTVVVDKVKANDTDEVDLSRVLNFTGPLASVSVLSSTSDLQVLGRIWNTTGFGDGQFSAAKLFSVSKTSSGDVIVVQQYAQSYTSVLWGDTFILSSDLQKWYTMYSPSRPIIQLDLATSGGNYLGAASFDGGIESWYWDGDISKRGTYQSQTMSVPGTKYGKVKVVPLNRDSFYILALDQLNNRVDVHFATVALSNYRLSKSGVSISDVLDFDSAVVQATNSVVLYAISVADPTVLKLVSWKRAFEPPTLTQSSVSVTFTKTAAFTSIKAVILNQTNFYLVLDAQILPYFIELAFSFGNLTTPTAPTLYMKAYPGANNCRDLRYTFDGSAGYIVALPSTPGAVAPVYLRSPPGTSSLMWYSLNFTAEQMISVGNNAQLATIHELANGESKLIQLSASSSEGQDQVWISSLKSSISILLSKCSPASLKASILQLDGERGVALSIGFDSLLDVPEPPAPPKPKKSNAWVHGILITMIVLVVVAAVYAFWRRNKDNEEGGNEELFTASSDHETFRKENESVYDRVA